MGLSGQLLGGGIGFVLGGPIGAILGVVIGSMMGSEGATAVRDDRKLQVTYFVAAFSMMGKLAAADGSVSEKEADLVDGFTRNQMRLDDQTRSFAMKIFREAAASSVSFEGFADQFYQAFSTRSEFLRSMLDMLLQVSMADGVLHAQEERLLLAAAASFRIDEAEFLRMKTQYIPNTQHHYAVLGCDANASMDEIKKKYRRMVQDFHPDKIMAKGLPEEFSEFASKKFHEIQQAYEAIKKEKSVA